jgi:HAD superfamily hydrolase (TIGR01509 family)
MGAGRPAIASSADRSRAVIFDLDGVLVDSEPLHVEAWKVLFARHGIAVTDEEYAHGIGMLDADWIRYLFERRGRAADPEWWQDAKRGIYRDILARSVRPFPGVVGLVRRLRPEFRLAVASNSWRENIETVAEALGLRDCFDVLTGKEDVARAKPHPDAYLTTAARLGVPPAACTVIEDSDLGVRAAKAAGMACIGVTNTLPAERLASADLIVASLADPAPILRLARGATGPSW